ncbi:MAG: DUF1257 domain-containing protein [Candidatus Omnitrophica bacterium]|nr:DUF1257 domain-containing protein [Candidatus Omnitrophota bacterium]
MSGHFGIGIQIRLAVILIQSLIALGREYRQIKSMATTDGRIYSVEFVTYDDNGRAIGFQKNEKGEYQIIADSHGLNSEQLKKQDDFIKQIRQKYAYITVVEELKKQGYIIAEEEKIAYNTIRLVARKWT